MRSVLLVSFILFMNGCTNIDRVAPMSWTYYSNGSSTESEIRTTLLECGYNVPGDTREFYKPDGKGFLMPNMSFNDTLLVMKCMQNSGFINREFKNECNNPNAKMLPACKPDAVIPKRSIETRLNSPYCKAYPKATYCQRDYMPSLVEHSKSQEPNKPQDPKPISIAPSTDPATKLQNRIQKDSNAQMNQLLQGPGSRR